MTDMYECYRGSKRVDGFSHRVGEAAGGERIVRVVRLGSVTSGPNRTCHEPIAAPKRPCGAIAAGTIGLCVQRAREREGGVARAGAQPRRRRAGHRRDARRATRRATSCSLLAIAPRRRVERADERQRGRADDAQPAAGCACAPRDRARRARRRRSRGSRRSTAGPWSGTCSPPMTSTRIATRDDRARGGRRVADRARTDRRDSGPTSRRRNARQRSARDSSTRSGSSRSSWRHGVHATLARRLVAIETTSAQSNNSRSTSCVGHRSR